MVEDVGRKTLREILLMGDSTFSEVKDGTPPYTKKKFLCDICGVRFTRSYNLKKHCEYKHNNQCVEYSCFFCKKSFRKRDTFLAHVDNHGDATSFLLYKDVFQGSIKIFRKNVTNVMSFPELLTIKKDILELIKSELLLYPKLKCTVLVRSEYRKHNQGVELLSSEMFNIRSHNFIVKNLTEKSILKKVNDGIHSVITNELELNLEGSGWVLVKIHFIEVTLRQMSILF